MLRTDTDRKIDTAEILFPNLTDDIILLSKAIDTTTAKAMEFLPASYLYI